MSHIIMEKPTVFDEIGKKDWFSQQNNNIFFSWGAFQCIGSVVGAVIWLFLLLWMTLMMVQKLQYSILPFNEHNV